MPATFHHTARSIVSIPYSQSLVVSTVCLRCRLKGLASTRSIPVYYLQSKQISYGTNRSKRLSTTSSTAHGPLVNKDSAGEGQSRIDSGYANHESPAAACRSAKGNASNDDQLSKIPKQLSHFINELTTKAVLVGQRVNTLTGTDYSAIEVLRRNIKEQGKLFENQASALANMKM